MKIARSGIVILSLILGHQQILRATGFYQTGGPMATGLSSLSRTLALLQNNAPNDI